MEEKITAISARRKYGRGKIKVKLFESLPMEQIPACCFRTSGNDQNKTRLLDMSIRQVAEDIALNTKSSRAVVLYINGRYWGIHNLRKVNTDYFKYRYGWNNDEFTEIQGSGYRNKKYKSTVDYAINHYKDSNFLYDINKLINVDNFFNFHVFKTY